MENTDVLIKSFQEKRFQNSLGKIRLQIEEEMLAFLKWLKNKLREEQRIFDNIESRIKSVESFSEKIRRNNYANKWEVMDTKIENQKMICINLPDLIGFRINCFFMKDEKIIYDYLKEYYNSSKFSSKIKLDFSENTTQENGHTIYKLTGIFEDKYKFEVQIKSLFHNVWGEVEHKTIYKGRHFDPNEETRKVITEEIFNVLDASDKQLLEMYKTSHKENQLIQTLFYYQTRDNIEQRFSTDILSKHYYNFFEIFNEENDFKLINIFVAQKMLDIDYEKFTYADIDDNESILNLSAQIIDLFKEYDLDFLYEIASILLKFDDKDDFIKYLSNYLLTTKFLDDEILEDEFSDYEDSFSEENKYNDKVNNAVLYLSGVLKRRKI